MSKHTHVASDFYFLLILISHQDFFPGPSAFKQKTAFKFSCISSAVKLAGVTKAVLSFNLWKPQQRVLSSIRGTCIGEFFLCFLIVKVNDTVNASRRELKLS